jgi:voltage-gated potassium channel
MRDASGAGFSGSARTPLLPSVGRSGRGGRELAHMASETRLERRIDRWVARAGTPRGAAVVIATVTTSITIGAGLLMTILDREDFPSLGSGLWWSVQTVTTVGYGDDVPKTAAGQIVAALVMLLGIGFITVITASITSSFVTKLHRSAASDDLREIRERLERIEAALNERP